MTKSINLKSLPAIVFLSSNNANFIEMYNVARLLVDNKIGRPYFIFERPSAITCNNELDMKGIGLLNEPNLIDRQLTRLSNKIKGIFNPRKSYISSKRRLSRHLQKRHSQCEKIINAIQPVSVVLRGDRHLGDGWEPAMIRVCKEKTIPRIVINYAYPSFIGELIYNRRNKPDLNSDLFPQVRNQYPNQVVFDTKKGKSYFYRSAFKIEAMAENNMLPENPWAMGGSGATLVLIDSEFNKAQYIKNGVSPKRIVVTGVGAHDKLVTNFNNRGQIRKRLFEKYAFEKNTKLVIVAATQLFEERLMTKDQAMFEFEYLCSQCSKLEVSCLLSLHPRMKKERYARIAGKYKLQIAEEPLCDILPAAHLFLANYSSTVQWAVLCHIPTVIFDFYDCVEPMYHEMRGVVAVDRENFLLIIDQILSSNNKYNALKQANIQQSGVYSPFDGKCVERIADILIHPLITTEKKKEKRVQKPTV